MAGHAAVGTWAQQARPLACSSGSDAPPNIPTRAPTPPTRRPVAQGGSQGRCCGVEGQSRSAEMPAWRAEWALFAPCNAKRRAGAGLHNMGDRRAAPWACQTPRRPCTGATTGACPNGPSAVKEGQSRLGREARAAEPPPACGTGALTRGVDVTTTTSRHRGKCTQGGLSPEVVADPQPARPPAPARSRASRDEPGRYRAARAVPGMHNQQGCERGWRPCGIRQASYWIVVPNGT